MKRLTLIFFLTLLSIGWATAQTGGKVVSGSVISSDDKQPIAGATVRAKSIAGKGTITDINGKFRLILPETEKSIIISFIGYKTMEVPTGKDMRVVLKPEAEALDEVMVVAYGTTKKQEFTGSAVTVSGEKLKLKSMNVTKALEGEVPGVQVLQSSGQPGSVATILVRGIGSANSSTAPLYVVDGVPFGVSLQGIDSNDIESISVLKDASATALYGSRAANGVVLITTRKGRTGNMHITAEVKMGLNKRTLPLHDVITSPEEYLELGYQSLVNAYEYLGKKKPEKLADASLNDLLFSDAGILPRYNLWDAAKGVNLIDPKTGKFNPNVKRVYTPESWSKNIFRVGRRTEATVNMSGGTDKMSFYTSAGVLRDQGYYIGSDFKRMNLRNNLTYNATKNFKNTLNLAYARTESDEPGQSAVQNNGFTYVNGIPPIYPVFERRSAEEATAEHPRGERIMDPKIPGGYSYDYGQYEGGSRAYGGGVNPAGAVQLDKNNLVRHVINGNYNGELTFLDNFKLAVNAGFQQSLSTRKSLDNPYYGDASSVFGRYTQTDNKSTSVTFNQILSYANQFGKHNVDAFVAHESYSYLFSYGEYRKSKAVIPDRLEFQNFLVQDGINSFSTRYTMESYFAQAKYNYDDRYFLSASLRSDGSSRFAPGKKWGTFGSLGTAWLVSSEEFMKDQTLFNELKLKASWGRIGNQALSLDTQSDAADYFPYEDFYSVDNLGGLPAFTFVTKGNPNLTWEVSNSLNIGLESRLFNALTVNVDWFYKKTTHMIFSKQVAPSQGFAYYPDNDGKLINTGIEADLRWDVVKGKDFQFTTKLNLAHYRNTLAKMPYSLATGKPQMFILSGDFGWKRGHSLYDYYTYTYQGVDQTNGKPLYKAFVKEEKNKDGEVEKKYITDLQDFLSKGGDLSQYTETSVNKTADAVRDFVGKSALPDLNGGFGFDMSYKGISLNTSFAFSVGGYGFDHIYRHLMSSTEIGKYNYHVDARNAWTPVKGEDGKWTAKNPGTDVPLLSNGDVKYKDANATSTRFLTSKSYLTISNVRLSYALPESWVEKAKLSGMTLYLSGDNLYTFTKRRGYFPTSTIAGSSSDSRYLPVATFTAGVQLSL